jgi:hypothetical protein
MFIYIINGYRTMQLRAEEDNIFTGINLGKTPTYTFPVYSSPVVPQHHARLLSLGQIVTTFVSVFALIRSATTH